MSAIVELKKTRGTYTSGDLRTICIGQSSLHIGELLVENMCILSLRNTITEVVDVARA